MKDKFEKSVLVPRNKSPSNSVAASIKRAFGQLTDRAVSQESSVSHNNGFNVSPKVTKPQHTVVSSASDGSTNTQGLPPNSPQSRSRKSVGNRLAKLRDIPSDGAITMTKSEVENIMNKTAEQIVNELEEHKYNAVDKEDSASDLEDSGNEAGTDTDQDQSDNDKPSDHKKKATMMEIGVINGKRLTIQAKMFTSINNSKVGNKSVNVDVDTGVNTVSVIDGKQQIGQVQLPKLPHSVTMAASMKQNNLFDAVDMIYDNFMDKNATYQINVSSLCRAQVTRIVIQHRLSVEAQREKLKEMDLDSSGVIPSGLSGIIVDVNIFDEACNEILALLRSSFYRFAQTKAYKVYCEALKKL